MFTLSHARNLCALVLSLSLSSMSYSFTQLISFGDSLSDRGNVFAATGGTTPVAPYDSGQFSNGTVWTGLLAAQLGVTSTASNLGGTNFAWGGARTYTGAGGGVPTTQDQVGQYLASVGGVADSSALYTIWTGGNDVNAQLTGGTTDAGGAVDITLSAATVGTIAQALVDAGAQNILINNLPDLGLVPGVTAAAGASAVFGANLFSDAFNFELNNAIAGIVGGNITLIDAFSLTTDIVNNPGDYGLTNTTDRCLALDDVTPCANPDDYLFWDDLHPTAAGHQLIADVAYAAVIPVPAALPLMLSALLGLGAFKRMRKA